MPVHVAFARRIRHGPTSTVLADAIGWTAAFSLLGSLLACTLAMLLANHALSLDL